MFEKNKPVIKKLILFCMALLCSSLSIKYVTLSVHSIQIENESVFYYKNQNACNHEHSVYADIKPATCTENGFTEGIFCIDCGQWVYGHETIEKNNHKYYTVVTPPTCNFEGYTTHICEYCNDYYINSIVEPLGHDRSIIMDFTDSTCTNIGTKTAKCSTCGEIETVEIPLKAHTHSDWIVDAVADCTNSGQRHISCNVCKQVLQFEVSAPLGHHYTVTHMSPTCVKEGVDLYTCSACGNSYSEVVSPKLNHDLTDWQEIQAAGCTQNGVRERKCLNCDYIEKSEIGAVGHKTSSWITDKVPDCENSGYRHRDCTVCKQTVATESIPAKGHKIVTQKAVAATCTSDGKTEGSQCSVCKKTLKAQTVIKAVGHKTKNTKTAATTSKNGSYGTTCSVCKKAITSTVIPKIASVKLSAAYFSYDKKVKTPEVIIKDSKGKTLKRSTDYTLKYDSGRKNIGTYSVNVTFKGNYSGTKKLTFKILPNKPNVITASQTTSSVKLTWSKVTGAAGYTVYQYDSKKKTYVKLYSTTKTNYQIKKLKSATIYKFAVKAYAKVNKTTYFSNSYRDISIATLPTVPTFKVTAGSKKATITWNKVSGASGYVIYMSTSKDGTFKNIASVKSSASAKYEKSGLTKGKTYYFKIRAYKTVGKIKVYSAYSAVKSVKVK
ncbi:MAG: fibronectin type III domain-containing protein [Faecalibacterium sp.]|nr:fibronectin type III domain-containing protein [Ruminococcus sp.]MCM1391842.1 fibronectin type III domain-containing protein [Ruminococcus sp.]MCM1485706.1 fibronectin type III domain-containing protein [Faecalibacterium sp.]